MFRATCQVNGGLQIIIWCLTSAYACMDYLSRWHLSYFVASLAVETSGICCIGVKFFITVCCILHFTKVTWFHMVMVPLSIHNHDWCRKLRLVEDIRIYFFWVSIMCICISVLIADQHNEEPHGTAVYYASLSFI